MTPLPPEQLGLLTQAPSLYALTGNITDFNTVLVTRACLTTLLAAAAVPRALHTAKPLTD